MYFANPWGLLALLSLPMIGVIHLFQRRFPPLLVAGAHLWGIDTRIQTAGRRRDRLPITATLLLELLAGLLFSLSLAQPRFGELGSVVHHVIVLDDSASMSSRPPGEPSFRDTTVAEIRRLMSESQRDSRVTLIRTGRQPTLLGTRAMTWDQAARALADWNPLSPRHDFEPAWDEAAQITGPEGQFLFLTDHVPDDSLGLPEGMNVVGVGQQLPNVSLAAARWLFDSQANAGSLFLRITNHAAQPVSAQVTAARRRNAGAGGTTSATLFKQDISIPPHGSLPLETTLPGGLGIIDVEVSSPGDGLTIDNRVSLVEPSVRMLSVALVLPDGSSELRLVQRVVAAVPDIQPAEPEHADLIIGRAGDPPPSRRGLWWMGIGPFNPSPVVRGQARDLIGPYLIEKQHPLMDGIVLGGVVWGGVQPLNLELLPLISAGRVPLLGQLRSTQVTAFLMNIDLARSNIGESPDWPILMTNLCELCRDELPGLRRWNYRLNENIRFRLPDSLTQDSAESTSLQTPSGQRRTLVRDRNNLIEITRLEETGIYNVRDGEQSLGRFAVNFFDPDESDLSRLATGRREATARDASTLLHIDAPYSWIMAMAVLVLLAVMLLNWWIVRPKGQMM